MPHATTETRERILSPYDSDVAAWAEEQAGRLRRRAELANNDELDWFHLAEAALRSPEGPPSFFL